MDKICSPQEVKTRIPHTWPLFFRRHGRFTPIQQQAIPPILDGHDALVIAATASGKTEAVIAPLLERYWGRLNQPDPHGLSILYICPTRALVRDLYERLQPALADTAVTMAMKTGDTGPVDAKRPSSILITTPESTDSLLTRAPRLFASLQAIIVDEVHLFDNTPRGDHVRCLLPRIEHIRQYARPESAAAQRIALSATVPDPAGVARRYLHQGVIVNVPGNRQIVADVLPLYDLVALTTALGQRAAQKSLLFCNTRAEVEQTAVYLRQHLPHHAQIFVHYSNLDTKMRHDVETRFAAASVAICVTTSTLELGIDIGSVDDVVLLGAPPNLTSFLQRIGRGGRRTLHTRVLCMPKSPGEWARFEALFYLANNSPQRRKDRQEENDGKASAPVRLNSPIEDVTVYGFRPSVLVQQIFSLIKQSPTGSIRLADVRRIAPPGVMSEDIRRICSELAFAPILKSGRMGEWKPDTELQEMIDQHEIYSNIGADVRAATAVDAYTGKVIAQTEQLYEKGRVVLFGGKAMEVVWQDKSRFGLAPAGNKKADAILRFRKTYAAIPFAVTQAVARSLAVQAGQMAVLPDEEGMFLFHFWGTVWGELLTAVLIANSYSAASVNEYCLHLRSPISQLPDWDNTLAQKIARDKAIALAQRLQMGRFHGLLPANVAVPATVRQLNLERFGQVYRGSTCVNLAKIYEKLHTLARQR